MTGRLHSPEVDAIWENATDDAFINQVRKHGPELHLADGTWPTRSHCAGSATKAGYMWWTREAMPHLIMPLPVEPKPGKPGRFRLIHESQILNTLLKKWPFRMDNLKGFAKQTKRLGLPFTIDIAPAYRHVEIAARHFTLLGFHFEGTDCVYSCLPFSLGTSAYIFCRFPAMTAESLRRSGFVSAFIAYVGDFGGSVGPGARFGANERHRAPRRALRLGNRARQEQALFASPP